MIRARRRGQALPLFAVIMSAIGVAITFFFDIAMVRTNAQTAVDGSLRASAIAGLHEVDATEGFRRWKIDESDADDVVRLYVARNLIGGEIGPGSYATLFDEPSLVLALAQSTEDDTRSGLDVEILNPLPFAISGGQSTGTYNGTPHRAGSTGGCGIGVGEYPEALLSAIDGVCYNRPTVVIRLRLMVDAIGVSTPMTRTISVSAGTNE
jgi:hypothetical protein